MRESVLRGLSNRFCQLLAMSFPGGHSLRAKLHRWRGVKIGEGVHISLDVILETADPHLITIEDGVFIGVRTTIIAHMRERRQGVKIERDAFIGAGVIIMPNVVVGHGAVVAAGSVVTRSVPPMTLVQGNPAAAVARCGVPLGPKVSMKEFSRQLKPLASARARMVGAKPSQSTGGTSPD
jgi:acetyltransferase-like isoleucine patch superfamily enzyme